ncbi:MAG TPA: CRTAC1 family protein [Candidatus Limnocylindria bacterium]|nr:CRTAC1 family protein [Candidatus Limnocylindria bacterium]
MSRRRTALVPAVAAGAVALIVLVPALLGMGARDGGALGAPHFVEEAHAAGITHRYEGEFTYFVGGGVAVIDCDGDGRQDLYFAGGAEPAALYRNQSEIGGALQFQPMPSKVTDLTGVTGAYPLDIDADGVEDLVVLRVGEDVLLRGAGDCGFERANERWGFDGGGDWTTAFSATWEADGLPTLAFGNYLELDPDGTPTDAYACADNQLVRPTETGETFAPASALSPSYCTLSLLFSDWDRSGRRDLRVSNDRHYYRDGEEQLWRVDPGAPPRLWTEAEGWQRVRVEGMGIASQDLTGDGYPEVFLTSQADNKLQTLADGPDQPRYEDIALSRRATAHRPYAGDTNVPSTAWHAEFADVNNDGFVDLYVAKGNVEAQPDFAARDPNNLLLGQPDGTFVEGAPDAGIVQFTRTRGAALADLNLDGLLDLVEVNRRENVSVWRNVGSGDADDPAQMGRWIGIRLEQDGGNRDAIGSWVDVTFGDRTVRREVTVGGGHASGQIGWLHFGIGSAESASVVVHWPDGSTGQPVRVDADTFATVARDGTAAVVWEPEE